MESLEDGAVAEVLAEALRRRKPFRHFKDALLDFPEARKRWFQFENQAHARYAERWCNGERIDAAWV